MSERRGSSPMSMWPRRATLAVLVACVSSLAGLGLLASTGAAALPDGRVWEQVSPADKSGADVIPNVTRVRSSSDGQRALFSSLTGFGDVNGVGVSADYLAERDPQTGEWKTHGVSVPQDATGYFGTLSGLTPVYVDASNDLSKGLVSTRTPLTEAPNVASAVNLYERDDLFSEGDGSYTLLTDSSTLQPPSETENLDPSLGFWRPAVAAASVDFSHVLFESARNLTADAPACTASNPDNNCPPLLYESFGGSTRLVGILPASEGGGVAPASQAGRGASANHDTEGTMSSDGSRVVFTVVPGPGKTGGELYLRDDHGTVDTSDDTTVHINASERATPSAAFPAEYWAASSGVDAQGDRVPLKVFFTTAEQLTEDDENASVDVYMWSEQADGEGHHLTRLSADGEPKDGLDPGVEGVIGASADGSYVYFVTSGDQLVLNGRTGSPGGPAGGNRIFVWHSGTIHEVGAVNVGNESNDLLGVEYAPTKASRVTQDGTHLLFLSEGTNELLSLYGLPEYDQGSNCNEGGYFECTEAYVYDATANGGNGELSCASCNPTGARATTDTVFDGPQGGLGAASLTTYQNHVLTDDGRFVFFNTAEPLVPEDINGSLDAYEYDTETHQVHLLSAGQSTEISAFMDASADGHDVLFTARDRLRSSDVDQSRDLYDAQIGGVPDPGVTAAPSCDSNTSCREPANTTPFVVPTSVAFQGVGNLPSLAARSGAAKPSSNTQRLRRALKSCRKKQNIAQRKKCELQARKRYGARKASSKSGGSK